VAAHGTSGALRQTIHWAGSASLPPLPSPGGELAANIEPYLRADGTRIWSLMQLERQLRPEAYGRRRGGYLDRRRIPAVDA
jgi:hypothetical protein